MYHTAFRRTTISAAARSPLRQDDRRDIARRLMRLLADVFALYLKTKNAQWRVSKSRDAHCGAVLAGQADQLFSGTDAIAERVRALGAARLPSVGHMAGLERMLDDDARGASPLDRLAELRDENANLAQRMREVLAACERRGDVATGDLLEALIADAEARVLDQSPLRTCFESNFGRPIALHSPVGSH